MRNLLQAFFICVFLISVHGISAQSLNKYPVIYNESKLYWDTIPDSIKYSQGSGYKQYIRSHSWISQRYGSLREKYAVDYKINCIFAYRLIN